MAKEEAEKVKRFFFNDGKEECVFCGSAEPERWDHLTPLKEGGETVIGNIVPACQPCDDSKQHTHFEKWMLGNAPKSPRSRGVQDLDERINKLKSYVKSFGYQPRPLTSRLSKEENQQYEILLGKVRALRTEIERFLASYKSHGGSGA
ncbi:MAG: HNH endonuclease [Ignavibacteriae bacterium]|nr:HNH endonuclease [Ignavibacteria bacterium]MBI3365025.1 HNH endonuclease [Ignavibacteriota bacterium]